MSTDGKPGWGEGSSLSETPPHPLQELQPGAMGQAMAMTAWAMSTLSQWPVRLHWCVDLARDIGPEASAPIDPSAPFANPWSAYLIRFRAALDNQKWDGPQCNVALTVRSVDPVSGLPLQLTYSLPWRVNLACLPKAPPPVGVWRLWWEPQRTADEYGRQEGRPFEGDSTPDSFWYDGIPF